MIFSKTIKATVFTAATLGVLGGVGQAFATVINSQPQNQLIEEQPQLAQVFSNRQVDQDNFLVVSIPGPALNPHPLNIIEQVAASPTCFREINPGAQPTQIEPQWLNVPTGTCRVQKDTNGYGLWLAGEDQGVGWIFKIEERGNDLVLTVSKFGEAPVTIGRSYGLPTSDYTRIYLNEGWYITQRVDNATGADLSFVYFTNDLTLAQLQDSDDDVAVTPPPITDPQPPVVEPDLPFNDIAGSLYVDEIVRAASLGVMSGFYEDGTFRPSDPLTREQAVSIVMESVYQAAPASVVAGLAQQAASAPFPDVAADRWSAVKISQAKALGIVSGDFETGNFRPADNVSRAELMAMLDKSARLNITGGAVTVADELPPNTTPATLTDISGHWGEAVIVEMAGYCGVATPLNETGTSFAPDTDASRDYAAAAVVRLVDCPARQGI